MEELEYFLKAFSYTDPLPLDVSFAKLLAVHARGDQIMAKGPPLSTAALQLGEQCEIRIESQGLFSSNEEADDVTTSQLRYLLAPYMVAELHGQAPAPTVPDRAVSWRGRLDSVQTAIATYSRFLDRLEQYHLVGNLGMRLLGEEEERGGAIADPATKRQAKIDRFKQDKAINAQLEIIKERAKAESGAQQQVA
eukprot:gene11248-18873_t